MVAKQTQRRSSGEHVVRVVGDGLSRVESMDRRMGQTDPRTAIAQVLAQARPLGRACNRRDSQQRVVELVGLRGFSAARTIEIWVAVAQSCPELGSLAPRFSAALCSEAWAPSKRSPSRSRSMPASFRALLCAGSLGNAF